jgi:hypothetical protein
LLLTGEELLLALSIGARVRALKYHRIADC